MHGPSHWVVDVNSREAHEWGHELMRAPWTEGNMTKHPIPDTRTYKKEKNGLNIHITRNEKVMLIWTAIVVIAGGVITSL